MGKKNPCSLLVSVQIVIMEIPQKIYLKLTATKPSYSTPRYIPRVFHLLPQRYLHIYVYCSYIYYSKKIEQCRHSSIEESIMKMYGRKMEYCLAIKKNEILRFLEHEWTENVYQARSAKFKENNQIFPNVYHHLYVNS